MAAERCRGAACNAVSGGVAWGLIVFFCSHSSAAPTFINARFAEDEVGEREGVLFLCSANVPSATRGPKL